MRKTAAACRLAFLVIATVVPWWGLTGCGSSHQEELAGVSVPIPEGMQKVPNSNDRIDLGPQENGEQATFRGEIPREEIVRFYHDVLPADKWQPDANLAEELGGYAFTRGDQTIAIRIHEHENGNTSLIVLANVGEFSPRKP